MSVWRLLAPVLVLLVVVGLVSLIAGSGALDSFERQPAAAPGTSVTLELPLSPAATVETTPTAADATTTEPVGD